MGSADPTNVTYPLGSVLVDSSRRELTGYNKERQDFLIGPNPAPTFAGYFCVRFSEPLVEWGLASNADGQLFPGQISKNGTQLSAYVRFNDSVESVDVRVGVSFISVDQARVNLDLEIPDGTTLEETARNTREAWAEKLDRIDIAGATADQETVFYTAVFHALQVRTGRSVLSDYALMSRSIHANKARVADTIQGTMTACTMANHILVILSG